MAEGETGVMGFLLKTGAYLTQDDIGEVAILAGIPDPQPGLQELIKVGLVIPLGNGYFLPGRGELWDVGRTEREQSRLYRKNHPEKTRANKARRRAREANAPVIEKVDYAAIYERDKGTCYLCGKSIDKGQVNYDHVIPLARGGEHTEANLKLTHKRCNSRKGARALSDLTWIAKA